MACCIVWCLRALPVLGVGWVMFNLPGIVSPADMLFVTAMLLLTTAGLQGSGWGWLGYNSATGGLEIATTGNQDPLSTVVGGGKV